MEFSATTLVKFTGANSLVGAEVGALLFAFIVADLFVLVLEAADLVLLIATLVLEEAPLVAVVLEIADFVEAEVKLVLVALFVVWLLVR